jgi:hypothetical protein
LIRAKSKMMRDGVSASLFDHQASLFLSDKKDKHWSQIFICDCSQNKREGDQRSSSVTVHRTRERAKRFASLYLISCDQ